MIDTDENKLCWHCLKELKSKSGKTRHIDSIIFCTVCWPVVSCSSPTTTRMTPRSGPRPSLTWAKPLRPVSRSFACFRTAKRRGQQQPANNAPKTTGSKPARCSNRNSRYSRPKPNTSISSNREEAVAGHILCGNFIHNNRKTHS